MSSGTSKVIVLVGGPTRGTRFRPLSLEVPKPLFPLAGHALIWHHISAAAQLPNLLEVILIGFYDFAKTEWQDFIFQTQKELNVTIRYIRETSRLGTAGGLHKFRSEIMRGNPSTFFVLHCDVICEFPLVAVEQHHSSHGKECTIVGKKIPAEEAKKYGCLAVDPKTNEILHYAEKPETYVSDIINCGVYAFSPGIFDLIDQIGAQVKRESDEDPHYLRLEQDVLMKICGDKHVYLYETKDFWFQVKSAGMVVKCSESLLSLVRRSGTGALAKTSSEGPTIVGDVLIDPSAKVHPSAKLGPNVAIHKNVVIGEGARVAHSIVLDGAEIKEHACVLHSIIGWNSIVGQWSRLEGTPDYNSEKADVRSCGITILGTGVNVAPEIVVRASIVLPHKDIGHNVNNQILL